MEMSFSSCTQQKEKSFFIFADQQHTKMSQLNSSFICIVYVPASFVRNEDREHKFYKIYVFYNPNEIYIYKESIILKK